MGEKEARADAVIDVGILAVGLSRNPATEPCLEVIEDAVRGRIRALIPYTVVFGAHYILTRFYGVQPRKANDLLRNLLSSTKIVWHGTIRRSNVEGSFENTDAHGMDAWDGYILNLMEENKIRMIYTLDMEDFGGINHIKAINPVTEGKMRELHHFLRKGNSS